jgi:hypothetical protein
MAMNPGYRGLADIGGVGQVRFSDANIVAKQAVEAPDLVMGDWDHDAYYYGKIEVSGSINGPVTETFLAGSAGGGLWDWGVVRTAPCGSLSEESATLYYYCSGVGAGQARSFGGLKVNSLNFSVTAGDIANFAMDVMGVSADPWLDTDPPHFTDAEKIITWDEVTLTITPGYSGVALSAADIDFQAFEFTIANNLEPQYSLAQDNLFPKQIVDGLRGISGTVTAYNVPEEDGADRWIDYLASNVATISFTIGTGSASPLTIDMKVQFHRVEPSQNPGVITSTIAFTGVSHQTGAAWEA